MAEAPPSPPSPPPPIAPLPDLPPEPPLAPGHSSPMQKAGGLPFEADECVDRSGPTFCTAFHRMGRCSRSLGMAMKRCQRACGICKVGARGGGGGHGGGGEGGRASHGSEEEDVSGYGHKATKAEMERLHEEEQSEYILEDLLLMAAFVACCCLGAMGLGSRRRWGRPQEKLEAKCAV